MHVIWPEVKIDAVTLALLVAAALPWLAPFLKSIELVGVGKVELRQIGQRVAALASRVDRVEQFVFSGDATPEQEADLDEALGQFHAYMRALGAGDLPKPTVHVDANLQNAQYDVQKNQVVLGGMYINDHDALFREYAHHVLMTFQPEVWQGTAGAIESGLADYFTCSFSNDPLVAEIAARAYGRDWIRNLDNHRRFDESDSAIVQDAGEVWGGIFWSLRGEFGQEMIDRLLLAVWKNCEPADAAEFAADIVDAVAGATDSRGRELARGAFEGRGLELP